MNIRTSRLFRHCITLLFAASAITAAAQPVVIDGLISTPYPNYQLSADERHLAFYERNSAGQRIAKILDLDEWTWKSTAGLGEMTLAPDFNSGYESWVPGEKFKGAEGMIPYKKYVTNYYTGVIGGPLKKTQWPDQSYILTVMPDGKLLSAQEVGPMSKSGWLNIKLTGLKIIDPVTGATIKELRDDELLSGSPLKYTNPVKLIDNGRLITWNSFANVYTCMALTGGDIRNIRFPEAGLQGIAGKIGISVGRKNQFGDGYRTNRKVLVDMETGAMVYDSSTANNVITEAWGAASNDGHFYTLDGATLQLAEEMWQNGKLVRTATIQLDSAGVKLRDNNLSQTYKMIAAKAAGKLMMLPCSYKKPGEPLNEAYVWDIMTGKMLYKIINYIKPSEAFLAKESAPVVRREPVKPNTLVQYGGYGGYYILLSQNPSSKEWSAIELFPDRHGMFERRNVQKPELYFSSAKVISSSACTVCKGSGKVNVTQQRSSSSVDNYNAIANSVSPGAKVITTTTYNAQVSEGCKHCKGTGFEWP